ncbi:helix-turn-helix domain-containing protein [Streptomyces fungicidicus]|uniref:helix-turn-helix domain-containing protein n=1 Tax=Streptomyces fungicidicus TaxID=68203 RepID=UPI0036818C5F
MRYAQGSGLTAQGDENQVIAHDLRVSVRSVQRWLRAWWRNGPRALASKRSAPARPSPGGRSSGTRRRWPAGGRRPGRVWKDRGGARRLARLRG